MENGKMDIERLDTRNSDLHPDSDQPISSETIYDCVWLVRFPEFPWKLNIKAYINILAATLEEGIYEYVKF